MCVVVVYIIQSTSASQHRFRDTFINMFIIFKFMVYTRKYYKYTTGMLLK